MEITGREVQSVGWMLIKHLSAELLQDVLTVEPCVAIDMVQLTMNFDPCCALFSKKLSLYHFTVGGCWAKSLHL